MHWKCEWNGMKSLRAIILSVPKLGHCSGIVCGVGERWRSTPHDQSYPTQSFTASKNLWSFTRRVLSHGVAISSLLLRRLLLMLCLWEKITGIKRKHPHRDCDVRKRRCTMSSTFSLPPEVLCVVFDKLFTDDLDYFSNIISCSLVSHTWNDVVTYLLSRSLNTVKLRGGQVEGLFRLSRLLETISTSRIRPPYSPDAIKTINLDMSYLFNEDGSYNEEAQVILIHLIEVLCTSTTGLELSFNHPIALLNWQEGRLKDFYKSL